MSVSLLKSFMPKYGGCEAKAMAKLNGEWEEGDKQAFLIGSYVHSWSQSKKAFQKFISENRDKVYKGKNSDGDPYAYILKADKMIETIKNDPLIKKVRSGSKEIIITEELFGVPFKAMVDIYNPKHETLIDLKTTKDIFGKVYSESEMQYVTFIRAYGYDLQLAIYAELERRLRGGSEHFMPHILAVTKEKYPDKQLINMGTDFIPQVIENVEIKMPRIIDVWKGNAEPERCERCDYCKSTKQLNKPIYYDYEMDKLVFLD